MYRKTHIVRTRLQTYFSIQIPYYTNVRKLCRYYNIFKFISFAIYIAGSIFLSSYVVWRNDLLIYTIVLGGYILESFVSPAVIPYYEYLGYTDIGKLLNV